MLDQATDNIQIIIRSCYVQGSPAIFILRLDSSTCLNKPMCDIDSVLPSITEQTPATEVYASFVFRHLINQIRLRTTSQNYD